MRCLVNQLSYYEYDNIRQNKEDFISFTNHDIEMIKDMYKNYFHVESYYPLIYLDTQDKSSRNIVKLDNNIRIYDNDWIRYEVFIHKMVDDYYLMKVISNKINYYLLDSMDGLYEFLNKYKTGHLV